MKGCFSRQVLPKILHFLTIDYGVADKTAKHDIMSQAPVPCLDQMKGFFSCSTFIASLQSLKGMQTNDVRIVTGLS